MQHEEAQHSSTSLQWWHYANLIAIFMSTAIVVGALASPLFGRSLDDEQHLAPNLLKIKSGAALATTPLMTVFGAIFAVGQALPYYRGNKVSKVLCPWFMAATVFLAVNVVMFIFQQHLWAVICHVCMLLSYFGAVWAIHATGQPTFLEYWVLRAYMGMALGGSTATLVTNISTLAARLKLAPGQQLTVALGGLTLALSVAVVSATALPKPAPWVPLFLAYYTFWISQELENPKALLDPAGEFFVPWGGDVIAGMRGFCAILSVACLVLGVVSMALRFKDALFSGGAADEGVEFMEQTGGSTTQQQQEVLV